MKALTALLAFLTALTLASLVAAVPAHSALARTAAALTETTPEPPPGCEYYDNCGGQGGMTCCGNTPRPQSGTS